MAISTVSELRSAVSNYTADDPDASEINNFISLAEARLNRIIRHYRMEASTDLTPSSGVCTLPTDYLEWRRVTAKTSPRKVLEPVTPDYGDWVDPNQTTSWPAYFAIIGTSLHLFPRTTSDIELRYYQKITALDDSNTTNWLLTYAPDIYLYATLLEHSIWSKDMQAASGYGQALDQSLKDLREEDSKARHSRRGVRLSMVTP